MRSFIFDLFHNFLKTLKVLILGIDGLEHALVEKWNMKIYKQAYYGKIDVRVAVRSGDPLYTPLIWSAFLLGEPAHAFGLDMDRIIEKRARALYGRLYPLFKLKKKLFGKRNLRIREFLIEIGLADFDNVVKNVSKIEAIPKNALRHTFVAEAENRGYKVFCKEFPTFKESKYAEMRAVFSKYYTSSLKEKLSKLNEVFDYSSKVLSETVRAVEDHDLILFYTSVIDYAQHMFYNPRDLRSMAALYSVYKRLADLIAESIPRSKNLCTLMVSDHGFDPIKQEHSDHGFWSINLEPPKIPKTILDFKSIILELLSL